MSRELNELELSSAIGGLGYSIFAQKSPLSGSSLGGQSKQRPPEEEEEELPGDWHDIIKL